MYRLYMYKPYVFWEEGGLKERRFLWLYILFDRYLLSLIFRKIFHLQIADSVSRKCLCEICNFYKYCMYKGRRLLRIYTVHLGLLYKFEASISLSRTPSDWVVSKVSFLWRLDLRNLQSTFKQSQTIFSNMSVCIFWSSKRLMLLISVY